MPKMFSVVLTSTVAWFAAPVAGQCVTGDPPPAPNPVPSGGGFIELDVPCPGGVLPGYDVSFGNNVVLDYNGDGAKDLAVAAQGQAAVYVFFGPFVPGVTPPHQGEIALSPRGIKLSPCDPSHLVYLDDEFGAALAAGDFDGDGEEELFVGAPGWDSDPGNSSLNEGAVYVFDHGEAQHVARTSSNTPVFLTESSPVPGNRFGELLAAGHFDGAAPGVLDLAVSTLRATYAPFGPTDLPGRVTVIHDVHSTGGSGAITIRNPDADPAAWDPEAWNGSFGQDLVAFDVDADGFDDLVVGAQGNAVPCNPDGGVVYVFHGQGGGLTQDMAPTDQLVDPNPLPPPTVPVWEGPNGDEDIRFGKDLDLADAAGEVRIAINAPRKDLWAFVGGNLRMVVEEAGGAFRFARTGAGWNQGQQLYKPTPVANDYLGFRAVCIDLVGDSSPDYAFTTHSATAKDPQVVIFDGSVPFHAIADPLIVHAPAEAGANWAEWQSRGALVPSASKREQLVLGDRDYEDPSQQHSYTLGRVRILYR